MSEKEYSRRECLRFLATLPIPLVLAGCATVPPEAEAALEDLNDHAPLYDGELTEFDGTTLDTVRDTRIQGIAGVQTIENLQQYRFIITGLVDEELSLTYEDVLALPSVRKVVTLPCVEGWSVTHVWDGVALADLLASAGYESSAKTLIFHSIDGYTTSLALDVAVDEGIIAWAVNGVTLPEEYGFPFRAVARHRFGYKWAKWISGIEVSDDGGYAGYWEQRGYGKGGFTLR